MNETELLLKCKKLEGWTFLRLAEEVKQTIPRQSIRRKGLVGSLIERILGADAQNLALPDFTKLGIELKTIPINARGYPAESTFVTMVSLLPSKESNKECWTQSTCFAKLKRVLWIPIEGDKNINFGDRRIGQAFLWSPSEEEKKILKHDWTELMFMIRTGKLADINASMGEYLQIRPKAAHGRSLSFGLDEFGNRVPTLPRGFYLRSRFTASILRGVSV